jgi:hypothetical protein
VALEASGLSSCDNISVTKSSNIISLLLNDVPKKCVRRYSEVRLSSASRSLSVAFWRSSEISNSRVKGVSICSTRTRVGLDVTGAVDNAGNVSDGIAVGISEVGSLVGSGVTVGAGEVDGRLVGIGVGITVGAGDVVGELVGIGLFVGSAVTVGAGDVDGELVGIGVLVGADVTVGLGDVDGEPVGIGVVVGPVVTVGLGVDGGSWHPETTSPVQSCSHCSPSKKPQQPLGTPSQ